MMEVVDVLLCVFATLGLTELVRHDVRVLTFIEWAKEKWPSSRIVKFVTELQSCGFCLSHWAAAISIALLFVPYGKLFHVFFAVTRLANILNDALHKFSRTPNRKQQND